MRDQALRFILEQPSNDGSKGTRRKRARLVTACDSCRSKKIKCTPSVDPAGDPNICEACVQGATPCEYSDRDRYHAERGVSLSDHVAPMSPSIPLDGQAESSKPIKRRRLSSATTNHDTLSHTSYTQSSADSDYNSSVPPRHPAPAYDPEIRLPQQQNNPSGTSPSSIVNGPPAGPLKRILVPFFRYFGPTANTPGYRRVKVRTLTLSEDSSDVNNRDSRLSNTLNASNASYPPGPASSSYNDRQPNNNTLAGTQDPAEDVLSRTGSPSIRRALMGIIGQPPPQLEDSQRFQPVSNDHLFDPTRPRYPSPVHFPHLATLFFDNLACHFPFLDRAAVIRQADEGTLSAILANCLAGLAIRFSDREELLTGPRYSAGEPFCDMAKLLIVHMLSWPSLEVLQALVLISWAEFGSGRDSGLWMYSRMAVAMAIDLGLNYEATIQLTSVPEERERVRLTWWAVVLIDRINSWGTGRPIAIADDQFDTAIPTCDVSAGEDFSQPPPPSFVYGHLCRLVQLRGKMGDVLNNQAVRRKDKEYPVGMELSELQSHMTFFYQSLPPTLLFTMQNFRRFSKHEQAPTFILLHVMFHSVITLLHRPALLRSFTPNVALPIASNIDLSRSSARSIVDMILLANEVDQKSLISNPFLDLPILTAARGFLAERETLSKSAPPVNTSLLLLRLQWGESSLEHCQEILGKMSVYWGGVGCVKMILDQQSSGRLDFDIGEGAQPDSRIDQLRDVELIKQWATGAWRRQRPNGSSSPLKGQSRAASPRASVPLLPVDHNNLQYGAAGHTEGTSASPEDAAIGITGFLDGPLSLHTSSPGQPDWSLDPSGGPDAFRISFNSAEADLSFGNLSSELFSISEGFEEFLASHTTMPYASGSGSASGSGANSAMGMSSQQQLQGHGQGQVGDAAGLVALGQAAAQMQQPGQNHVNPQNQQQQQQNFQDFFPVFSSLGLPMPQQLQSRAPSPFPR